MPTVRTLRVSNPHKKSRRKSRRNSGVLYLMANPKKSRRHRTRRHASARRSHRNPFKARRRNTFRRRSHRRNPMLGAFSATDLIKLALGAAGGTLATKYVTQAILQDKNTGTTGYAVMAAVAVALGWVAAKFAGKEVATGVVAGGASAVVLRIFQEQVSGTQPSMSGLGDPDFALGEYQTGVYPVPGWSYAQPALPAAVAGGPVPAAVAAAAAGAPGRANRSAPRS